jgi:tetratricopeptide (TPR) repeat protein
MKRFTGLLLLLLLLLLLEAGLMFLTPAVIRAQGCKQWAAKMISVQGTVQVKREGGLQWEAVKLNETYCPGDTIRVQDRSRADLALTNQPVLRLDQNTTLTLRGLKEEKTSLLDMAKGAIYIFSRAPKSVSVNTAFVNAGIEGTEFLVRVDENSTFISVFEGKVLASNQAGSLGITGGQSAVAEAGRAPVPRTVVRPRDAVQWTLYFPPVLALGQTDFKGLPDPEQEMIKKSLEAYSQGNLTGAMEALGGAPEKANDPRLFNYRASLLLAVGRVDEARRDLEQSLKAAPNNSDALALQAAIAVALNQKEEALGLAKKAVEADPKSASALISLSYAQQAHFNLEGARKSLQEAVQAQPDNALAWARLAEMQQSFGELGRSLEAAQKAVKLNPNLSRTQTVLGFAHLTRVETRDAREAFEKAIQLDQADPLPRLGLGLAVIRDGRLSEGRQELEAAVSLDPDKALLRSYLGKAYYDEKRDKLASDQYAMAKQLDPKDPTAFFYEAIQKQTTNRPVEALQDLQKAIELNDNRAVYRSQLLLDQDLAARSAGLARIYSDLGFQQLALAEGWKSVNTDPANYSAHRFLADSYSVLPRHEIARVSELLQSQLLQPENITPIQPRLAESNLFVVSGGGPTHPSFNEFNPLFNRNRIALQGSGLVGENNTAAGEIIAAGLYDKVSFSMGGYGYQTDGFRNNNDLKDSIFNAFLQTSLSPSASLQAEYRYRNLDRGDVRQLFFQDDYSPYLRQTDTYNSIRLGGRYDFSTVSTLIGNFMYNQGDSTAQENPTEPSATKYKIKNEADSYSGEMAHIFTANKFKLVSGAGYFDIKSKYTLNFEMYFPEDPFTPVNTSSVQDADTKHTNLYVYSYFQPVRPLTITVGASADFLRAADSDVDQFNPKMGIVWNPVPDTTIRAAAFRTLKRTLITNQTLEPTQVAGFNQFYDDPNGTEAWRYGLGVDQKFFKSLYGGAELSYRELQVPFVDVAGPVPENKKSDWKEYLGRAYLYWTPYKWVALKGEYLYEKNERNEAFTMGTRDLTTNRFPLGVYFFHPSGLSAFFRATYYIQKGEFETLAAARGTYVSGDDQFWVCDAAISYRLPKRYGFLSAGATNLFNQSFKYYDTDTANPSIQPSRMFFVRATLAFP